VSAALRPGFADPVRAAQTVFRAVLDALARPGTVHELPALLDPPPPLTPALAAVALALADAETGLWLDAPLAASAEVGDWLRFHAGAGILAEPGDAAFALVADAARLPAFASFAQGTDEYPDRSVTLVLAVDALAAGDGMTLRGPGILDTARLRASPLPSDFAPRMRANRVLFPRGVDLLLAGPGRVAGLPRSVEVED
jgi:alpha-D-ribose 1-methylphosphonate 5-triphosphate synthase subunit PhnH